MSFNHIVLTAAVTLLTISTFITSDSYASRAPTCDQRLIKSMNLCSPYRCKTEDNTQRVPIIHTIRGVDEQNLCNYTVQYSKIEKKVCKLPRADTQTLSRLTKTKLKDPEDALTTNKLNSFLGTKCTELNSKENLSRSNKSEYYTFNNIQYPALKLESVCVQNNPEVFKTLKISSGSLGFVFDHNYLNTLQDQSSYLGQMNYPLKEFMRKTCSNPNEDIYHFSHIHFNTGKISPEFKKNNLNNIKISLINPHATKTQDKSTYNDTYKVILASKDSFSAKNYNSILNVVSANQKGDFYKIIKNRERMIEDVKPFILIKSDGYTTRAKNPFTLECYGKNSQTVCDTQWIWGGNLIVRVQEIPYEPENIKFIVATINGFIDQAYTLFKR